MFSFIKGSDFNDGATFEGRLFHPYHIAEQELGGKN